MIDVSKCHSSHSLRNKIGRTIWMMVWWLLYRPSPKFLAGWRRFLLQVFGAKIGEGAQPHATAKIWAPWNLEMGDYSCLSHYVDCYCVDKVTIGSHASVSQYSFLCTASHDITHPNMPLVTAPISIGKEVWIAADVFIAPGVIIGEGAVVGARSSVFSNVSPWTVTGGNPARKIKDRIITER